MDWITAIGLAAATLTTSAFLPQAIKTIRTKHTKDISFWTYLILLVGLALWLIYGLLITDWPVILANATTLVFVGVIFIMKLKYG
jgi:MtN3 and saliva related transmembrane protein